MHALDVSHTAPGFERFVPPGTVLDTVASGLIFTEGPVWQPKEGCLFFVDIRGDRLLKYTPGKGLATVIQPAGKGNGLTLDHDDRILCAGWGGRTVWRLEPDGSVTTLASHWQGRKINTPNDIVVKSDGTIWWTDMINGIYIPGMCTEDVQRYLDFEGVFRLNAGGAGMALMADDLITPNGLCFSPDEKLLYVNESSQRRIRVWDVGADNTLANGRLFYKDTFSEMGVPDGMKVDVEGNVYCTGSAGIHIISPDGQLLGRIHTPEHAANMAWADDDWRTMYITARGIVYRTRLGIPGVPHGHANRKRALAMAGKGDR
jgi:gluconolactonase